ncbi:MAG TPA: trehalose-6-phosphate synthase [candidate division Zixibacteria bacterium]|nr:trehalose-6-phosphate synthase [candidate division Zixibacteria bacterium]
MPQTDRRLFIVSNRLPLVVGKEDEVWKIFPSSGGLVTALDPLMKQNHGLWLGWAGVQEDAPLDPLLEKYSAEQGYELKAVPLDATEVDRYYRGFSNQTIWPLFHDLLGYCTFDLDQWNYYNKVNEKFATEIARLHRPDQFIWIHDYQLMLVAFYLREMGISVELNFFLHIPFPSADLFARLPWKNEIIYSLLEYDHIGFQTAHDRRNFAQCVKSLIPNARVTTSGRQSIVHLEGRKIKLGTYPISIDFNEFNRDAKSKEVAEAAWFTHENLPGRMLLLGLDRLDYTKGMPERFLAFQRALEKYPDLHRNVSLVQIVVPSRLHVPEYQELKEQLDTLAGNINGRFSQGGWVPIHYMFRELERTQLLGYYRACEIALITPLRDGMNLVSKEYCASSVDNNGVLILSEFAGAADQMSKGAIMVNPYDVENTADAIYQAYVMTPEERQRRMRLLRSEVRRNDVHRWVRWFLESERRLVDRPPVKAEA